MPIDKLHKRSVITVLEPDIPDRTLICVNDAIGRVMVIMDQLLKEADLQPKDQMTVDIRVMIERGISNG